MHIINIESFGQELTQIWEKKHQPVCYVHRFLSLCSLLSLASLLIFLRRCTIHFKRETKSCLKLVGCRDGEKVRKQTNRYSGTKRHKKTYTHARTRIQQGNLLSISCFWLFPLQGWFLPQERAAHECKGFGKSFVFVESVNHPLLSHTFVNQASLWQPAAKQLESSFHGTDGRCEST